MSSKAKNWSKIGNYREKLTHAVIRIEQASHFFTILRWN